VIKPLPNLSTVNYNYYLLFSFLVLFISFSTSVKAQEKLSSDELFQNARTAAFDEDDYPKAIRITKQALEISPDYADIRIFLGRLYTWTDEVELAKTDSKLIFPTALYPLKDMNKRENSGNPNAM
jgi:tetratricopeptide (TPR) repeat protein